MVKNVDKEIAKNADNIGIGYRHQQCYLLFFCLTIAYSIRACLGVALVAMTTLPLESFASNVTENDTNVLNEVDQDVVDVMEVETDINYFKLRNDSSVLQYMLFIKPYPLFDWSKKTQDTVTSSFFWGYMLLQIPSGVLAHKFGSRYLLTCSMMINGIISLVFPWAAYYGGWLVAMACRFIQGLTQACIFPSIQTFLGKWAPLHERGRLAAIVYGGQALGPVVGLPLTGLLASSSLGWPGVFRFYGILCIILGTLIWYFLADTPEEHPKISAEERFYIEDEVGGKERQSIPWNKILKSKGMWAIIAGHISQSWGQVTLYTEVPAYMDKVMGVNVKANGVLTAIPFLAMFVMNYVYSYVFDMIVKKQYLSVTNSRKLANSFGSILTSICLITLCYVPRNIYIVEAVLIVTCSVKVAAHMGFQVLSIDIAPNFAGTMLSISNFVSNSISSFAPVVAGLILTDASDPSLWNRVFLISAGLYFFSNIVFVILATAERAEWNEPLRKDYDPEECELMSKNTNNKIE